ncbi:hypothetical protein BGZ61DRAFT_495278 [Ilyonectria robusta]|uniref:uncharacterized protein n=1 Tax=Ilyonectria robusta TaxID=1079257 RepID=UPI001E8DCCAF|nr:uncharacterized protein BGZ61DRAFT_495278 [Ilyonectria robusta]KAH8684987.1 hypothetical protein BGZ61DRAFT_495278 [Ilyonectria robusta]
MTVNYSNILWFYGFRCLGGGKFYICKDAKTEFVGCCNSDPCVGGKGVCPKGKLRQMAFSQSLYGQIPTLGCDDPTRSHAYKRHPLRQTTYPPFLAYEPSQDKPQSGIRDDTLGHIDLPVNWHGGPKRLHSPDITWFLDRIWDLVLTFLPLCFIALAFVAIRLDNQPHSQFGQRVVELTRLSPTIYPILFAAIVSRFYKALARWYLEKPGGIRLAVLEQIFGSQSFVAAFERVFFIRTQAVVGSVILLTWAMSPLGGQSASRLLYNGVTSFESNGTVYYANPAYQMSYYSIVADRRITAESRPSTEVLYSTSLFSSPEQKGSPRDLWGLPKIPQWPRPRTNNRLYNVSQPDLKSGKEFYSSLLGISIKGLAGTNFRTHFDFSVQTSYFDISCDLAIDPSFASFYVINEDWEENSEVYWFQYVKQLRGGDLYIVNCSMHEILLETAIRCGPGDPATSCEARRQRRLDSPSARLPTAVSAEDAQSMLADWAAISNEKTEYIASPTDLYIMKGSNPYSGEVVKPLTESDLSVFPSVFSSRITTAFNTFWTSTLNPHGHTNVTFDTIPEHNVLGLMNNQTTDQPFMNTTIGTRITSPEILAISGLVLEAFIRGPDILGFASSMTRDNPYVPLPPGGSHLDGTDRSRRLRDVRLELSDVRPDDENGYVALRAVPSVVQVNSEEGDEEDDKPTVSTGLNRKRLYE